jgi:hypothetical protein
MFLFLLVVFQFCLTHTTLKEQSYQMHPLFYLKSNNYTKFRESNNLINPYDKKQHLENNKSQNTIIFSKKQKKHKICKYFSIFIYTYIIYL